MSEGGLISAGVWYCCPIEDPERVDMWAHQAFDGRQDYESPAPGAPPRRMKH